MIAHSNYPVDRRPASKSARRKESRTRSNPPVDGGTLSFCFEHEWAPDFAGAINLKEDGWIWTHIYLVWSDLSVYATISKPPYEAPNVDRWAIDAVNSLKRRTS